MTEFDQAGTEALLRHFYTLTGMKICVFDRQCREIAYYPEKWQPLCAYVHSSPEGAAQCAKCERYALESCRKAQGRVMFSCGMGLLECAAPIVCDGDLVGYVMLGQLRSADGPKSAEKAAAVRLGLDGEKLQQLYEDMKPAENAVIQSAAEILEACASYIWLKGLVRENAGTQQKRIDEYLAAHLSQPLDANALCRALGFSRTALYRLFRSCYGETVLGHVTRLRIAKACTLLRDTGESVAAVSGMVGFSDYNYFIKVFKRSQGISPLQYRKRLREGT